MAFLAGVPLKVLSGGTLSGEIGNRSPPDSGRFFQLLPNTSRTAGQSCGPRLTRVARGSVVLPAGARTSMSPRGFVHHLPPSGWSNCATTCLLRGGRTAPPPASFGNGNVYGLWNLRPRNTLRLTSTNLYDRYAATGKRRVRPTSTAPVPAGFALPYPTPTPVYLPHWALL